MMINGLSLETHGTEAPRGGKKRSAPADALVLIHGIFSSRQIWTQLRDNLETELPIVTYDLRGGGESEIGSGQYTLEGMTDDLFAILDSLKIRRAVLCGHTLGAHIAFRALERDPERVAGVAACNAIPLSPATEEIIGWSEAIRRIQSGSVKRFVRNYYPTTFAESSKSQEGSPYRELLAEAEQMDATGVIGRILAMLTRTDARPALEATTAPVLCMTGDQDEEAPHDALLRVSLSLSGMTVARVPDSGHALPGEYPRYLAGALDTFIRRVFGETPE